MEFTYKNKTYELGWVVEPDNKQINFGIVTIFTNVIDEGEEVRRLVGWFYDDGTDLVDQAKLVIDYITVEEKLLNERRY